MSADADIIIYEWDTTLITSLTEGVMDLNKKEKTQKDGEGRLQLRKYFNWNIGTVIFMALFLYMFVSLILYLTANHISSYQVTSGPLSKNENCTVLVMRDETVVKATASGYVNFFTRDYSKVRKNGIVYGIGNSEQKLPTKVLDESDLNSLRSDFSKFSRYYTQNNFSSVYDFKYAMEEDLLSYSGASSGNPDAGNMLLETSDKDGIVVYSTDGIENLSEEELSLETFEKKNYVRRSLKSGDQVAAGDAVYKLVTSEEWSVIFPVTDRQVVRLASRDKIKVKFLKDGECETGKLTILTIGEQRYIKITFSSGMIRYANERYLDVELVTNTESGLKIPVSSIVKKEFYTIPVSLRVVNDNNTAGFRRERKDKDGKITTEFIDATVYARLGEEGNELCYLDKDTFSDGDILVNPETNVRYTVGEKASLEGVYCINKGYAVFRTISIIDQNEEYCIVEAGTRYGISQFDYIVLDGSTVNEKEILY